MVCDTCAAVNPKGVTQCIECKTPLTSKWLDNAPPYRQDRGDRSALSNHYWAPLSDWPGVSNFDLHYGVRTKPLAQRTLRVPVVHHPCLPGQCLLRRTDPVYDHLRAALATTGTMEFPPKSSTEVPKQHLKTYSCRVRRKCQRLRSNGSIGSDPSCSLTSLLKPPRAGSLPIESYR